MGCARVFLRMSDPTPSARLSGRGVRRPARGRAPRSAAHLCACDLRPRGGDSRRSDVVRARRARRDPRHLVAKSQGLESRARPTCDARTPRLATWMRGVRDLHCRKGRDRPSARRRFTLVERVHRRYDTEQGAADPAVGQFLASDDVALRLRPSSALTWDERDSAASRAWSSGGALPLVPTEPRD
jgi:hypothetical protein